MASLNKKIRHALYSALNVSSVTDLATGGVWHKEIEFQLDGGGAPIVPDVHPATVVFERLVTDDIYRTFGYTLAVESTVWIVKVHIDKSEPHADTPSDRADDILQACEDAIGNELTLAGAETWQCERERDLPEQHQKIAANRYDLLSSFLLKVVAKNG